MKKGLVSVSFRSLTVDEIIKKTREAGLFCIEWGSDVHVPPNDIENAKRVYDTTVENGLFVSSYGSYFNVRTDAPIDIKDYISTAKLLHTDIIRIWCGKKGSADTDAETRALLVANLREACDIAEQSGITLALECHNGTVTDDYRYAVDFIEDVGRENARMYWQPNQSKSLEYNIAAARALKKFTKAVHVFQWDGRNERYPLASGEREWGAYIDILRDTDCAFLLEFVPDDEAEYLAREADVLTRLLG